MRLADAKVRRSGGLLRWLKRSLTSCLRLRRLEFGLKESHFQGSVLSRSLRADCQRHNVAKRDINVDARFSCRLHIVGKATARQLGGAVTKGQQGANLSRSYSNIQNRMGTYGLDFHSFDLT